MPVKALIDDLPRETREGAQAHGRADNVTPVQVGFPAAVSASPLVNARPPPAYDSPHAQ